MKAPETRPSSIAVGHRNPDTVVGLLGPGAVRAGRPGLGGRGDRHLGRLAVLLAVRARLGPRLPAGEGEAHDRPVDHAPLLEERAGVVGQLVALADRLDAWGDLGV